MICNKHIFLQSYLSEICCFSATLGPVSLDPQRINYTSCSGEWCTPDVIPSTGAVALLVARSAPVLKVLGSNPAFSTTHMTCLFSASWRFEWSKTFFISLLYAKEAFSFLQPKGLQLFPWFHVHTWYIPIIGTNKSFWFLCLNLAFTVTYPDIYYWAALVHDIILVVPPYPYSIEEHQHNFLGWQHNTNNPSQVQSW